MLLFHHYKIKKQNVLSENKNPVQSKIMKKSLRIVLILIAIVIYTVLVAVLTLAGLFFYLIHYNREHSTTTDINDYKTCLNKIEYKEVIGHFPDKFPQEAKNLKFYCYIDEIGSNGNLVLLTFETNEKYITDELQKLEYINDDSSHETLKNIYPIPSEKADIPQKELTFYFKDNGKYHKNGVPYFSGIGINKNKTNILYYCLLPKD